ncbi:hypothetical protein HPP92_007716 [Vanilla planifolia]|uniref:Uncharacterized protein n=1 Tax=Vanilla planifolia TaxID=51239 RepID=A0A835V9P1_VANPL|nr:hypothetical protein HPP92_007716 [Vanilla planifolia]
MVSFMTRRKPVEVTEAVPERLRSASAKPLKVSSCATVDPEIRKKKELSRRRIIGDMVPFLWDDLHSIDFDWKQKFIRFWILEMVPAKNLLLRNFM